MMCWVLVYKVIGKIELKHLYFSLHIIYTLPSRANWSSTTSKKQFLDVILVHESTGLETKVDEQLLGGSLCGAQIP